MAELKSMLPAHGKDNKFLYRADDYEISIEASVDAQTNILTIKQLLDGEVVSSTSVPIITVSIVRSVYFDTTTMTLVLEFSNGQELRFNLAQLISGVLPTAMAFDLKTDAWQAIGANMFRQDLTAVVNEMLKRAPVYTAHDPIFLVVEPQPSDNPSALHWCEYNDLTGSYFLSEDTYPVPGKTYYFSNEGSPKDNGWYEKGEDNIYRESEDTFINPEHQYFIKSFKELSGSFKFDAATAITTQATLDALNIAQLHYMTTKNAVTDKWELYCMITTIGTTAPAAQFTIPTLLVTISPAVDGMDVIGQPVYRSTKDLDALNMSGEVESDSIKRNVRKLEVKVDKTYNDLQITSGDNGGVTHKNQITAGDNDIVYGTNSVTFKKLDYDAQGHVKTNVNGKTITSGTDLKITNGKVEHTNTIVAGSFAPTIALNSLKLSSGTYDANGHLNSVNNNNSTLTFVDGVTMSAAGAVGHTNKLSAASTYQPLTITASSGTATVGGSFSSKKYTYDIQGHISGAPAADATLTAARGLSIFSNTIGHSNNITANGTSGLKFFTYDANGHVLAAVNKTLGRGISDSSNVLGHSNTAITAGTAGLGSQTACITGLKWDGYGHLTAVPTTAVMYPPTTVGTSGQLWQSKGSGAGQWLTISTSISASSTDTQVPSAKCMWDTIGDVSAALAALTSGTGV